MAIANGYGMFPIICIFRRLAGLICGDELKTGISRSDLTSWRLLILVTQSEIIVCCPHVVSGGPEGLHQLVDQLIANGRKAHITYYPFDVPFSAPEAYRKYVCPQGPFKDEKGKFIVIPESATWIAKKIKNAKVGVWWQSVDNYFLAEKKSYIKDFYYRYKSLIRRRMPLSSMKEFSHFAQSKYAVEFLHAAGIAAHVLADYLSQSHLEKIYSFEGAAREDLIVYNPLKGRRRVAELQRIYPSFVFMPIENMGPSDVANLFRRAKIYIDFGHHPGKDRLPREAAIAGCCIVTGRQGSARYYEDLPILDKYKLDDGGDGFLQLFGPLVQSIFDSFDMHSIDFDSYRNKIQGEPSVFKDQVGRIFG
jgi:hypothetical protein